MHTIVIGAGSAGLAASYTLRQRGIEHVVLERGKVGESWRSMRWDSFCLNTPEWKSLLPGQQADEPDTFRPRDQVVSRFEAYRQQHDLPVREGVTVTRVQRTDDGFVVHTAAGEALACTRVVVATGDQNLPTSPAIAASTPPGITTMHAADYRSPDDLPPGGVLVVGSGQTGAQIAEELIEAGRPTWLCTSRVGRVRRTYRGKDSLYWADKAGFYQHTKDQLPDPAMASWRQPLISGAHGGHTLSFHELARQGITLLGRLEGFEGTTARIGGQLMEHVGFGDAVAEKVQGMLEAACQAVGGDAPAPEPDPAEAPFEGLSAMAGIRELDMAAEGITSIIWATGFSGDFSYLPAEALQDGQPVHENGVSPVPGLVFVGLEWLRKRDSGLICGVGTDAAGVLG